MWATFPNAKVVWGNRNLILAGNILISHSAKIVWISTSKSIIFVKLIGMLDNKTEKNPNALYKKWISSLMLMTYYSNGTETEISSPLEK